MGFGDWLIRLGVSLGGQLPPTGNGNGGLVRPQGPHAEISETDLRDVLRSALGNEGDMYIADHNFWLCELDDIERFLDWDETNHHSYEAEVYDCDDFAKRLWGQFAVPGWSHFAFGLVWTNTHAMNILVDTNRDVWLVEPQTDTRRSALLSWQDDVLRYIVV